LCSEHFLVMDEPFTGLDPIMKETTCELINKVATLDERNTIFVVAHDIAALVQIADCLWLFGRDRDEQGNIIPGATIKKQYNLIDRGLAWRHDIVATREFADFVTEVRSQFKDL
jgi:ABC-type nitrate/sulfonate/bicarbonate transport system ATPase subunit